MMRFDFLASIRFLRYVVKNSIKVSASFKGDVRITLELSSEIFFGPRIFVAGDIRPSAIAFNTPDAKTWQSPCGSSTVTALVIGGRCVCSR